MKRIFHLLALAIFVAGFGADTVFAAKKRALTPLELQAIQSREFETNKDALFASVMSVFQDLGYTIDSADIQTGFITAQSPTINKTNFGEALTGLSASGNTKATAFVEFMPSGRSRVRLNFVNSKNLSGSYGQASRVDRPILDPQPYLVAWDKIDEALFVRGALTKAAPGNSDAEPIKQDKGQMIPSSGPSETVGERK